MNTRPLSTQALGDARADKRLQILDGVRRHGSISQAARAAGVSYKAAWQALHTLTNLAGEALVDSSVGGAGGGGARLTPAGERLLQAAGRLEQARRAALSQLGGAGDATAVGAPRTSMRNTLRGRVSALVGAGPREPMVRVRVALDGGAELAALITRESAELLGLRPGLPVQALCKATAVHVLPWEAAGAAQDGNRWPGRAARVSRGELGDEVAAQLDAGVQMVGFAAAGSGLRARSRVMLAADESAIVLAVV